MWLAACGLRLADCGLRIAAYGLWLMAYGLWLMAYGMRPATRKTGAALASTRVALRHPLRIHLRPPKQTVSCNA
ncbi:hypothetical protein BCEP27_80043 [Burkholderia cepacia]